MLGAHSKKPRVVRGSERLTTRLSELAGLVLAEREGFEPSVRKNRTPDFESGTIDHSAISPQNGHCNKLSSETSGIMFPRPLPKDFRVHNRTCQTWSGYLHECVEVSMTQICTLPGTGKVCLQIHPQIGWSTWTKKDWIVHEVNIITQ